MRIIAAIVTFLLVFSHGLPLVAVPIDARLKGFHHSHHGMKGAESHSQDLFIPPPDAASQEPEPPPPPLSPDTIERIQKHIAERVAQIKSTQPTPFQPTSDSLDGLPLEKQGLFAIQMPSYNGVVQLLPLSNKWLIVATFNLDEVSEEIAKLAKQDPAFATFDFLNAQKLWKDSVAAGRPNWTLKKTQVDGPVHKYFAQARLNAGEQKLDDAAFYSIVSTDDETYKTAKTPLRVTRFMASLDAEVVPGIDPYYALYSYLELPEEMSDGKTYTVLLGNGKSVTFVYDELTLVSRAIKTNQVGYLPDAKKFAYLGAFLQDFGPMEVAEGTPFSVLNATTGEVAFTGPIALRAANPSFAPRGGHAGNKPLVSGENIYEMDFSSVTTPGVYLITIHGVGRSWPFTIDQNAYGEAFYTAARGLFHQRCGIELKMPYTPWLRIKCHLEPAPNCQLIPIFFMPLEAPKGWREFDIIGATMDTSHSVLDHTGGWHDAGDWQKKIEHYTCLFDLLTLCELKPKVFADRQLNLPESGNGIPDILSEAEYGLLVWKKSMTPEGGVAGRLEARTHPNISDPNFPLAYSLRTRWSSLLFAAASAYYAQLVKPFSAAKAVEYEALAKQAYAFGIDPKNSLGTITIQAREDRGTGKPYDVVFTEDDRFNKPFLIGAKLRLYLLTGDQSYAEGLSQLIKDVETPFAYKNAKVRLLPTQWPFSLKDCSLFLYAAIFHPDVAKILPQSIIDDWRQQYISLADRLQALNNAEFYRRSRGKEQDLQMRWGDDCMTNHARVLLFAHHLTGDSKYRQAALYNIDYMLGGNATAMSWTTGIGYVYPIPIHHRVSQDDGIRDPVPGLAIYGPDESDLGVFNAMWLPKDEGGKPVPFLKPAQYQNGRVMLPRLRNWVAHPNLRVDMNEFTIWETMSSGIFAYGYLLEEGWAAPKWLQERKPRDPRVLFGQWYLP